jgi:DNA invertase Pin-like site-specific DNA recombinase
MIRKAAETELRAESERDRIRGRVLETKADQRRRGRHLGGYRPFGFRIEKGEDDIRGGQLVPDEREQAAIAEMRALKAGGQSLRAIAAALKERGISISHEGVAEVLKREAIEDAARVGQEGAPVLRAVSLRRLFEVAAEIAAKHEARYRTA